MTTASPLPKTLKATRAELADHLDRYNDLLEQCEYDCPEESEAAEKRLHLWQQTAEYARFEDLQFHDQRLALRIFYRFGIDLVR